MNAINLPEAGKNFTDQYDHPTALFEAGAHAVYWLGTPEATAFRCNSYLIVEGEEAILVDPGGSGHFEFIKTRVAQILNPEHVAGLILSRHDPDIAASFPGWVDLNPSVKVITSYQINTLLSHYREVRYDLVNIREGSHYYFHSGNALRFVESPFLHSPGTFVTYDPISKFLFSSDIWSAVDMNWKLVVTDFHSHILKMNLFHLGAMASHIAARGFYHRIKDFDIQAILPQHGSILPEEFVEPAKEYLSKLSCGLDLIYPELL